MATYYVTFGQKYAEEEHPSGVDFHPDGVLEVTADDEAAARQLVFASISGRWAFIYPAGKLDLKMFPLGITHKLVADEANDWLLIS